MGPTNSGFIEASNNKLNEGFAIRGTGILKLQLSQKQTPQNLAIHYIRTNTEWNFASIKVFAEGKYIGASEPPSGDRFFFCSFNVYWLFFIYGFWCFFAMFDVFWCFCYF